MRNWSFSLDGDFIIYLADQDTDDVYNVELSTPGVARLNPPMTPFGGAWFLETTSDSLQVFYVAEQDNDFFELYRVDISAPGASTTINGSLAPGGEVRKFLVKPGQLPD